MSNFDIERVLPADQRDPGLISGLLAWRDMMPDDLLRAAVLEPERALPAFERARQGLDLANKAFGQVLPQVHFSIGQKLTGDPMEPHLKVMRVQNAFKNQLVLRQLGMIARGLEERDVDFLILRGLALALTVYPHPSCRSVRDIDVLVRAADFVQARDHLVRTGWSERGYAGKNNPYHKFYSSCVWKHDNSDVSIDLHTVINRHAAWHGLHDTFWDHTTNFNLDGVNIQTLSTVDHLLQVCVNGLKSNPPPHWALDAHWLLKKSESSFDWDRLVATAARTHSSMKLSVALAYLQYVFDSPIPAEVSRRLRRSPMQSQHLNLWAHRLGIPEGTSSRIKRYWREFREIHSESALLPSLRHLPGFLRDKTGSRTVLSAYRRIIIDILKSARSASVRRKR